MGFGNWSEIAKQMQTKNSEECLQHYLQYYVNDPHEDMPAMPDARPDSVSHNSIPLVLKFCDNPPRPLPHTDMALELAGYMPGRGDFNTEYDDFAETLIKDVEFDGDDDDDGNEELLTELKLAALDIFYTRLKERHYRKRIIRRHGLINVTRDVASISYGKNERQLRESLRVFTRLLSPENNEMFIQGVLLQQNLMKQVTALQGYRRAGLKHKRDAPMYKKLLLARNDGKAKRNLQNDVLYHSDVPMSCQLWLHRQFQSDVNKKVLPGVSALQLISRKPAAPLDLSGTPGVEQLTEEEKDLCSQIRLLPLQYVTHKNTMKRECQRLGSLKLQQARPLIKIDVNKTKKLYDFFMSKGWIYNTETPTFL